MQPPDPLELWESDPFELVERDGWLYARGVADDKGHSYMLLKAAELLAAAGELPVNLRIACDGEEEVGGHSIVDWIAADERGPTRRSCSTAAWSSATCRGSTSPCAGSVTSTSRFAPARATCTPACTAGVPQRDARAHADASGVLLPRRAPARAAARRDRVAVGLRARGLEAAARRGRRDRGAGSRPADGAAGEEFYLRTWAEPSVDVNGIEGGSPTLQKTVIAVEAEANVSIRLVPEQDPAVIVPTFERLLREAAPDGPRSRSRCGRRRPRLCRPDAPAVQLGLDAFEEVLGVRPLLVRSGGAIPLVSELAARGVATILTGFARHESNSPLAERADPVAALRSA